MSKKKKVEQRVIPATNGIKMFFHCRECLNEYFRDKIADQSPADYSKLDVGFTDLGIQVWCRRHELNVAHIDFEGACHPANQARAEKAN